MKVKRKRPQYRIDTILKRLVSGSAKSTDPVVAGSLCLLHKSDFMRITAMKKGSGDSIALTIMCTGVLRYLASAESDPQVKIELERAHEATLKAQEVRLTMPANVVLS